MKFPFPVFRDDKGRLWPAVEPHQSDPTYTQRNTLAAKYLNCAGCIFHDGSSPRSGRHHGECKRHAPTLLDPHPTRLAGDADFPAIFPMTAGSDWCGDFAAAPIDEANYSPIEGDEDDGQGGPQ